MGSETVCRICGGPDNLAWSGREDLWLAVNGEKDGIMCLSCFDEAARKLGARPLWYHGYVCDCDQEQPNPFSKVNLPNDLQAQLTTANELLKEARQHINDPLTVGKSYLLERIEKHLENT